MRTGLTALGLVAACLAAPAPACAQEVVADPWEGANRQLFAVHETIDRAVLSPLAHGYRAITPRPVRTGVTNFLRNLRAPVTLANDLLQGEVGRAGTTIARFGVNTTIGVGGLLDPARTLGLEFHEEDFGQTLGAWGVDAGPYVFIPVLGPTNVRDAAGRVVDFAFDPLAWASFDEADEARAIRTGVTALSTRESLIEAVDNVREDSMDPYVSIRTTYSLLRESAIGNGKDSATNLPNFDEDFDMPPTEEASAQSDAASSSLQPAQPTPPSAQRTEAPPGALQGDPQ